MPSVINMLKAKISLSTWMLVYLFSLATSLYALGLIRNSFNVMLIVVMAVSLAIMVFKTPYFRKREIPFYALYSCMCLFALLNGKSFRIGTFHYAGMFIFSFCFYDRLLCKGLLKIDVFCSFLKKIIYAYFIVLVIQQVSTLLGLPVLNQCWKFTNIFKLNSLAHEPSYIAGTMLIFMYSFLTISKTIRKQQKYSVRKNIKKDRWVWISFFYVMLSCGSSHALLGIVLFSLYLLREYKKFFVFFGIACALIFFVGHKKMVQYESYNRLYQSIVAAVSLDTEQIRKTDISTAARINPIIFYIEDFDFFSKNVWFGHGIDYSKKNTIVRLLGHENAMEQGNATGGLFPAFFLDYGLLCGLLFLFALRSFTMRKFISFPLVIWLFFFIAIGFNTYMQWLFFAFMSTTLFFERKSLPATYSEERSNR